MKKYNLLFRVIFNILLVMVLIILLLGCNKENKEDEIPGTTIIKGDIVIGGIFHDDISGSADLRLKAVMMAVEEINSAKGIYGKKISLVNIRPTLGENADAEKAAENAKILYDSYGSVGIVTLFSSIGEEIIKVTNTNQYKDLVQCNCSATNPFLNDPSATEVSPDKNDTFYRTVVTDTFQGKLWAKLIEDKVSDNAKIGIYYIDDTYGRGLKGVLNNALPEGVDITFDKYFSDGEFIIEENSQYMDELIVANLDILILICKKTQSPNILKYLVENGFKGSIIADGIKVNDIFTVATGLCDWLNITENSLLGVEPDGFAGKNSNAFIQSFVNRFGEDPDTYSSTAYDAVYAFALSLLYSGQKENYVASDVKENIIRFKELNRDLEEEEIGIGSDEFKRAEDIIESNGKINFEGASGQLIWNNNGDRIKQGMDVFSPNSSCNGFEVLQRYDDEMNEIE